MKRARTDTERRSILTKGEGLQMRSMVKLGVVALPVLAVLGAGLVPPVLARGELDGFARDAAQKGGAVLLNEGPQAAQDLAQQAGSSHPGVQVDSVTADGNDVLVTLSETVHTFIGSFHLRTTEGSSLGD
jgi:hypothetical protein